MINEHEIKIDLRQGDCLEVLKSMPSESIDLIVTDPPYLMNYKTNHRKNKKMLQNYEKQFCNVYVL